APEAERARIAQPPTRLDRTVDSAFRATTVFAAWCSVAIVAAVVLEVFRVALPAMRHYGLGFITSSTWDANRGAFGILPEIFGTLYSSFLGLAIGSFFGLAIAVFLSEGFLSAGLFALLKSLGLAYRPMWSRLPDRAEALLKTTIELLAAI